MLRYHSAPSGHWLVAAADGRLLAVRTPDEESTVERAWASVTLPIQSVLDELTSGGLSSTPPFALVEYSGEFETGTATAHCIVRGDAKIEAVANGESVEIDGASATTWAERTLEGVQSLELIFGSGTTAPATLPLANGVAWVDRVTLARGASVVAPVAAAVPAAASAPVPVAVAKPVIARVPTPVPAPVAEAPAHVAPPVTPILAPRSSEVEDATIAEFTVSSSRGTPAADSPAGTPVTSDTPETADAPDFGYDSLFEETMVRSIEDAAVRPEEEGDEHAPAEAGPAADGSKGDHDGMTMMSSDFAALRAARKKGKGANAVSVSTPSAPAYRLEIAGGGSEPLSSTVLVGRAPSVSKISGGQIPRLVTLTGSEDISRNHAQFSVEGDTVVVTDLHSRNGTSIILPGRSPQLLRAGEPTSVLVDTVVDLGGGVTLTVKEA